MRRAAALELGIGGVLMAASCGQVAVPARLFEPSQERLLGLAVVPVFLLGLSTTLFAAGAIAACEGVCAAFGGTGLYGLVSRDPPMLYRLLVYGTAAGLVLEIVAQWLGRLWFYPYWTPWFYALLLLPGFAFYWLCIVESYLAAKAVLDAAARPRPLTRPVRLWPLGVAVLAVAATLFLRWYALHGFAFAITRRSAAAPPFWYALLAVIGVALLSGPLVTTVVRGYWVPWAAVALASAVVSVALEVPNAVHEHWAYAHFPGPSVAGGLPLTMFLAWPLQYAVFLAVPSLFVPGLADAFWHPPGGTGAGDGAQSVTTTLPGAWPRS